MKPEVKRIVKKFLGIKNHWNTKFWETQYNSQLLTEYRYASAVVYSYPDAVEHVWRADMFMLKLKKRARRAEIARLLSEAGEV